jgi:hypothetical protein
VVGDDCEDEERRAASVAFFVRRTLAMCCKHGHCFGYEDPDTGRLEGVVLALPPRKRVQVHYCLMHAPASYSLHAFYSTPVHPLHRLSSHHSPPTR